MINKVWIKVATINESSAIKKNRQIKFSTEITFFEIQSVTNPIVKAPPVSVKW